MKRWLLPAIVVLATLALFLVCLCLHPPRIEADVTARAREGLRAAGFESALVSVRGRDATLTGAVASEQQRDRIVAVVSSATGVRAVADRLTVTAPSEDPILGGTSEASGTLAPGIERTAAGVGGLPAGPTPGEAPEETFERALEALDVAQRIEFGRDSAELTAQGRAVLDELAVLLASRPDVRIEISGHTDSRRSAAYNADLSRRRAEAARDYLVASGLAAERFETRGAGESQPLTDNASPAGRQRNRRVEFHPIEESR